MFSEKKAAGHAADVLPKHSNAHICSQKQLEIVIRLSTCSFALRCCCTCSRVHLKCSSLQMLYDWLCISLWSVNQSYIHNNTYLNTRDVIQVKQSGCASVQRINVTNHHISWVHEYECGNMRQRFWTLLYPPASVWWRCLGRPTSNSSGGGGSWAALLTSLTSEEWHSER